ncbi:hypothetical protein TSAR_011937 [Trichomalopsis sarcophagae]|uniref:Uncharacterized protein n=1 Tax=Trichomalopsis sarcophagae TaxID=543379 RepID=A0A232F7J7_9HYME|nr:hypothetical protein TSAR_011937 [Trichomalopsis sarcophagae]
MGQRQVGRMPENREALYEEWRRVLHWSAEVLARTDDNILEEDSFLTDYDCEKIAAKVDDWIVQVVGEVDADQPEFRELANEVKYKMRKDYDAAYKDLRRFTKSVDHLADMQKSIHKKILDLEKIRPSDGSKFRRKFGRLRLRVFKNLRTTEKMMFRDRRLKKEFVGKVYDVDHENRDIVQQKAKKLIGKN